MFSVSIVRKSLLCITILSSLLLLYTCNPQSQSDSVNPNSRLDSLFRAYYDFKKEINPLEATKAGYHEYDDEIANFISQPYLEDLKIRYTAFLKSIAQTDTTTISSENLMSLKVMKWDCEIKLEGLENPLVTVASPLYDLPNFELMPIIQMQSLHVYVPQLAAGSSVHPFKKTADYKNWLFRLKDYAAFLDSAMVNMEEGMAKGIVLPQSLVKKIIPQVETFAKGPVENHLFYNPVKNFPASISQYEKQQLADEYRIFIDQKLIPLYRRLHEFLKNRYLPAARSSSGISVLPGGAETYRYLLRLSTSTSLTPEQIHQLGLSEVNRIEGEMNKVREQMGFKGSLKEFIVFIRNLSDYKNYTDAGQVIKGFDEIRKTVEQNLDNVFLNKPKAGFEVRRTEAFREASASAEYVPGAKDGSRAGIFYVPVPDVKNYNRYSDESLFLHEAIPGHHYQLSLQQENTKLPEFLHPESMAVFVEGWALYAESLGSELGLYKDPIQYFGMLSMEMHRAIRLVVDTGIHGLGWTREDAIRYSLEHEAESEADIITEVERYMATPGQAVAYKIGQLKIRELRAYAEHELGDRFSLPEFHDQVLGSGSLPLFLLEEKIRGWVRNR